MASRRPDRSSPNTTVTRRLLVLPSLAATADLAGNIAAALRVGDVIRLRGELGAGKSALARAIIQARAGIPVEVTSPTFTIVQHYPLPGLTVLHADFYRLRSIDELAELGIEDALAEAALLVEWPEIAGGLLPDRGLDIELSEGAADEERIADITALDRRWSDIVERLAA